MTNSTWRWADLTSEQRQMLAASEQALGVDYLLAYQGPGSAPGSDVDTAVAGLEAAPLTESQIECLQGLETQLQAVVIAYHKSDA